MPPLSDPQSAALAALIAAPLAYSMPEAVKAHAAALTELEAFGLVTRWAAPTVGSCMTTGAWTLTPLGAYRGRVVVEEVSVGEVETVRREGEVARSDIVLLGTGSANPHWRESILHPRTGALLLSSRRVVENGSKHEVRLERPEDYPDSLPNPLEYLIDLEGWESGKDEGQALRAFTSGKSQPSDELKGGVGTKGAGGFGVPIAIDKRLGGKTEKKTKGRKRAARKVG